MEIEIDEEVKALGIHIVTDLLNDIKVGRSPRPVIEALFIEVKRELRERYSEEGSLLRDQAFRSLRDLYWRIGIDPTKTRPASEALVRRMLKKDIPTINMLVDAGNLASARTGIPIGIYDAGQLVGPLRMALTQGGEVFHPIGGEAITLGDGVPVLKDDSGPIHLYPYRDCMRTRITDRTRDALVIACGAKGIGRSYLEAALHEVGSFYRDLSSG